MESMDFTQVFTQALLKRLTELLVEKKYETEPLPAIYRKHIFSPALKKVPLPENISFEIKTLEVTHPSVNLTVVTSFGPDNIREPYEHTCRMTDASDVEMTARRMAATFFLQAMQMNSTVITKLPG